jgi:hypothetical protein
MMMRPVVPMVIDQSLLVRPRFTKVNDLMNMIESSKTSQKAKTDGMNGLKRQKIDNSSEITLPDT